MKIASIVFSYAFILSRILNDVGGALSHMNLSLLSLPEGIVSNPFMRVEEPYRAGKVALWGAVVNGVESVHPRWPPVPAQAEEPSVHANAT